MQDDSSSPVAQSTCTAVQVRYRTRSRDAHAKITHMHPNLEACLERDDNLNLGTPSDEFIGAKLVPQRLWNFPPAALMIDRRRTGARRRAREHARTNAASQRDRRRATSCSAGRLQWDKRAPKREGGGRGAGGASIEGGVWWSAVGSRIGGSARTALHGSVRRTEVHIAAVQPGVPSKGGRKGLRRSVGARLSRMDGSEGRLGFGGQEEAPAGGAPPKALGDTGGWDPDHIETVRSNVFRICTSVALVDRKARCLEQVSFEKTFKQPDDDQGRSYAGLLTAEDHKKRREQLKEQAFTKQEQEADPVAFRRKRAQEAIRQDEGFKEAEQKAREERLASKRAKLAAELAGGGKEKVEEEAGAAKGGKDKKNKKAKKKKVKSSLLSFGDGDDEDG
eukprot:COSAG02_NODE_2214_length_9489_cov_8.438978_8_plen_392_part_00